MHEALDRAADGNPQVLAWSRELQQTRARHAEEQVLFDRELSYTLQPRERLLGIIERYRQQIG